MSASQVVRDAVSSVGQMISSCKFPSNGDVPSPRAPSVNDDDDDDTDGFAVEEFVFDEAEPLTNKDSRDDTVALSASNFNVRTCCVALVSECIPRTEKADPLPTSEVICSVDNV